jgi:hypothetical protein
MTTRLYPLAAVPAMTLALAAPAAAKDLTIGYVSTLSGPAASLGVNQVNGLKLGLEHHGWNEDGDKISGVPSIRIGEQVMFRKDRYGDQCPKSQRIE